MTSSELAPATESQLKTPYQLNIEQTTQACKVLLRHITEEKKKRQGSNAKQNLLAASKDDSDDEDAQDDTPIWLILSTKKHVVDKARLKPSKITIPHPLNTNPTSTICLITADPSSTYTALLTTPTFPAALATRITRVLALSTLKTTYRAFEARRKLLAEHDIFLADDRIMPHLPALLGKTFYKSAAKRPIPVSIAGPAPRDAEGKRVKPDPSRSLEQKKADKAAAARGSASAEAVAREVERALGSALVNLAPGAGTAVRVGHAGMGAEQVRENVEAVVEGLVGRFVPQGWRGVRALHIKGPETASFPIWMAEELWVGVEDVYEEKRVYGGNKKKEGRKTKSLLEGGEVTGEVGKKRKAGGDETSAAPAKHAKKKRRAEESREKLEGEAGLRRELLKKQKEEALVAAAAA